MATLIGVRGADTTYRLRTQERNGLIDGSAPIGEWHPQQVETNNRSGCYSSRGISPWKHSQITFSCPRNWLHMKWELWNHLFFALIRNELSSIKMLHLTAFQTWSSKIVNAFSVSSRIKSEGLFWICINVKWPSNLTSRTLELMQRPAFAEPHVTPCTHLIAALTFPKHAVMLG